MGAHFFEANSGLGRFPENIRGYRGRRFSQAERPPCHPTNSVKLSKHWRELKYRHQPGGIT